MSHHTDHLRTAGKITVYTTFLGIIVFAFIFVFNIGEQSIKHADAQDTATTSVTVLNTPPLWTSDAHEAIESSSNNPTNAGDTVSWSAVGTDSNGENYWLLVCSTNATPTPNSNAAPTCSSGIKWAVSSVTTSGQTATAATTTLASWSEVNTWFAWICDGNAGTPRCNNTYKQGTNATNSSPFEVNHRPSFTALSDNSPANPGQVVTFTSTSADTDVSGTADRVKLFVCSTASFNTTTNTCDATTLASTTVFAASNATSTYTIVIPTQDQNYGAFGYVIDSHGFEASGGSQGADSVLSVNNVAPTVAGATVSLVQASGTDMYLTQEASTTQGFTLSFIASDNNSCDAAGGGAADEVTGYNLSIYRSGIGPSSCFATSTLNANNCYPSGAAPTAWNLSCTASTTSCTGATDTTIVYNCTFPLWYVADPTDGLNGSSTIYFAQDWRAQVKTTDDDGLSGPYGQSTTGVEVKSFLAFALNTLSIAYGSLEPGQNNPFLSATSTVLATGNVGVDKNVEGESMCNGFSQASPCAPSATSTIPESEQHFGISQLAYGSGTSLSSTTPQLVNINVPKSTATSTQATANAYWGIRVPGSITYAGSYTGLNTFYVVLSDPSQW
ncbi:MAG TPA: hypothetical protein VFV22_02125 [Candidatus Paceibacterota bacterium]|nr:hypothetical protein [Candidatus Paceibacterota bacterium]